MKKGLLIASFLLTTAYAFAQVNSVLNVVSTRDGRAVFNTGDVKKITFSGAELMLLDSEETTHSFDISELLSLNFRNYPVLTSAPSILTTNDERTRLYPNPASEVLFIDPRLPEQSVTRVEVLSLNGRILISGEITNNNRSINVSELSPGIYICRIFTRNMVSSSKFIKQ